MDGVPLAPATVAEPLAEPGTAPTGATRSAGPRVVHRTPEVAPGGRVRVSGRIGVPAATPHHAGRAAAGGRKGAVAVVIAEPAERVFADPFFARQLSGISQELAAHRSQPLLTLMLVERPTDYPRIVRYLTSGRVDGALMFSLHAEDPLPTTTFAAGLPTVFGGRPGWPGATDDPGLLYVDTDNRDGARQAVRHLLDTGRRRVAVITGPLDQTSAVDRLDGYLDALGTARPDPALLAHGDFTTESGERATADLLGRSAEPPDAIFAANDLMATGALRALRAHGLRVPQDVAVVGYDDLDPATGAEPALTTVRQDVAGMGAMMADLLLRRLDGTWDPEPSPVVTPAHMVLRASA